MSDTLALLHEIRRRPGMYIGQPSLIRLAAFLRGYDYAQWRLAGHQTDEFLSTFRDWIHERFGSTEVSWEEAILKQSPDDAAAQELFWTLLDEFVADHLVDANSATARTNGAATAISQEASKPAAKGI